LAFLDRLIAASIGLVPKFMVRRVAWRYVAGETLDDAIDAVNGLVSRGCCATFDLLGEFVEEPAQADAALTEYRAVLDRIHADGLDANISIKLTAFGLLLNEDAAYGRARELVIHAASLGNFVRIDMEDSTCTDATFRIYRRLREDGRDNVGLVLQAYLRRTGADVNALADLEPSYRLCKGIYVEPEEIAFKGVEEIRDNYRRVLDAMFDGGSYVGIATHDPALVEAGCAAVDGRGLARDRYEFQMLLGVTEGIRDRLVAEGHRLRVYVPFGRDWYAYCVRRLKENPRIGRYVFLGLFRSGA
jgi:proline dehydrogenase